jgi:hypothetical protein
MDHFDEKFSHGLLDQLPHNQHHYYSNLILRDCYYEVNNSHDRIDQCYCRKNVYAANFLAGLRHKTQRYQERPRAAYLLQEDELSARLHTMMVPSKGCLNSNLERFDRLAS